MKKLWLLSLILSGLNLLNGCGGSQSIVGVSVQPPSAMVLLSTSQPFRAVVTGTSNVAVTWSVKEGAAGGSIDNQGNYTAPQIAGSYHVIATSIADQSKSGSATITVPVAVNVSPNPVTVFLGGTQTFSATVAGTSNLAVTWSVQEGTAGGSIDNQGNYTAPQVPGTYHVVATSVVDPTQNAPATVTVPPISVTVSPDPANVFLGATQAFTATVTATNPAVAWTVQEGGAGGSIDSQGNYTAPQVIGTYHVIATSLADKSKSGSATITVPPVAVSISPTADTLGPNSQRIFVATVTGSTNTTVTWTITEGAAGGTVVDGSYTAPAKQGDFHVVATSVADPTKSATATVTGVASGFLPIANMTAKRAVHTATLLSTGKALFAGGINHYMKVQQGFRPACFPVATNLAELFDPGSGTFTATGAMSIPRSAHTATVLPDNKVLVAGGSSITPPTAEIYDPATEAFTTTGNMVSVRLRHTATLLPDGKVLLAGGDAGGGTAELFDPATGTFTASGSMTDSRSSHTATLLQSGKVLIAGGIGATGKVSTAELYDPVAGTFTATGDMGTARANHTATLLLNGTVLIAGGDDLNGAPLGSAEIYDPKTGAFSATGSMVTAHTKHTATLLQTSGKVLIAGGGNYVAELFDPVAATFTQTGSMFLSRTSHAAVLLPSGQVVVTGSATPVIFSCLGGATTSAEDYK